MRWLNLIAAVFAAFHGEVGFAAVFVGLMIVATLDEQHGK